MKKLQKIKLINWHNFWNETITLKNNCLFTGENGSGKSTILDAIQFVLTAGKAKFNQAADETNKRTLETYIRGKVGYENKEFLREGDITSYIVLEFFDEETNVFDLLGSVIEFNASMNRPARVFFRINNTSISDELFILDQNLFKTLNQFIKTTNIETYNNSKEFENCISAFLGLSSKGKYFDLLPKSLAFKPIKDINQFVNEFLLSEKTICLDALQRNISNFSILEKEIELEEEKIKNLEEIENNYNQYKDKEKDIKKNQYLQKVIQRENLKSSIDEMKKTLDENNNNIKLKTALRIKKEIEIEDNKKNIEDYTKKLESNEEYKIFIDLDNKLNDIKRRQEELIPTIDNYSKIFEVELKKLNAFSWIDKLKKESGLKDIDMYESVLLETINDYRHEKEICENLKFKLEYDKKCKKKELESVNERLELLKQNKFLYSDSLLTLQKEIKDSLTNLAGKTIEVRPLCEYLDITDEDWRDAVEGYLNTQRFDLIIEPIYFDKALHIYDTLKKSGNVYGVGLVNTNKLVELNPKENTLASKVKSNNIYAKRYALSLLNKVVCCEELEDLKNYNNSITKTCMTYRNHVARQINPKVYNDYYIGQIALERQLKNTEEEYNNINNEYTILVKDCNELVIKSDLLRNSKLEELRFGLDSLREFKNLKEKYVLIENEKGSLKIEGILNNFPERIEEFNRKNNSLLNEVRDLIDEVAELKNSNKIYDSQISEKEGKLNSLKIIDINSDWEKEFQDKCKTINLQKYEKKLLDEENGISKELQKLEATIEMQLNSYNKSYHFDQIPAFNNVSLYMKELYFKRERGIVDKKDLSAEFKESCQLSFKEDFICRLREQIESAQREIKELNKVLKPKKFGKESYEFVFDKCKNIEMADYYRIITSGANYEKETLFDEDLSIEDKNILNELFNKLTINNTEDKTKKLLDMYTDYRNYMSYDIKITNDEGYVYYFSSVSKEKSGGEIQTPFYVIISSAFEQLLVNTRRKSSTGCIVMFDEAFNNMDEFRIEAMMDFYKSLNIQFLIAVPSEKVHIIAPYVDTTLAVINTEESAYVKSIRYEDEEIKDV